jgi:hypothetical protein
MLFPDKFGRRGALLGQERAASPQFNDRSEPPAVRSHHRAETGVISIGCQPPGRQRVAAAERGSSGELEVADEGVKVVVALR